MDTLVDEFQVFWWPYERARAYVHKLKLKTYREWLAYSHSGKLPNEIPMAPSQTYQGYGWKGFHDWLGPSSARRHVPNTVYRPFEEARAFARSLGLTSRNAWMEYARSSKCPKDIPLRPWVYYRDQGWVDTQDWLYESPSQGKTVRRSARFLSFEEARVFVHMLGLRSASEWRAYSASKARPANIPSNPALMYKDSGWAGMKDWLGYGNNPKLLPKPNFLARSVRSSQRFPSFEEARKQARAYAAEYNITTYAQWVAFAASGVCKPPLPRRPEFCYKACGWKGIADWLGKGRVKRTFPQGVLPFIEARTYVRSLGLRNGKEWRAFCASGKLPATIPMTPWVVYKGQGWAGLRDWIGVAKYLPFERARKFVRSLNLSSAREWRVWYETHPTIRDIPKNPGYVYRESGWAGMRDWLGK